MCLLIHRLENLVRLVSVDVFFRELTLAVLPAEVLCNEVASQLDIRDLLVLPIQQRLRVLVVKW